MLRSCSVLDIFIFRHTPSISLGSVLESSSMKHTFSKSAQFVNSIWEARQEWLSVATSVSRKLLGFEVLHVLSMPPTADTELNVSALIFSMFSGNRTFKCIIHTSWISLTLPMSPSIFCSHSIMRGLSIHLKRFPTAVFLSFIVVGKPWWLISLLASASGYYVDFPVVQKGWRFVSVWSILVGCAACVKKRLSWVTILAFNTMVKCRESWGCNVIADNFLQASSKSCTPIQSAQFL